MKFPIGFGWWFSARLNKGRYSTCLNPHIGIYRPQRGGYMLRFNPNWPIWNVELGLHKRRFRPNNVAWLSWTRQIFKLNLSILLLQAFEREDRTKVLYLRIPFCKTKAFKWTTQTAKRLKQRKVGG